MSFEYAQLIVAIVLLPMIALLLGHFANTISETTDAMRKEETGVDVNGGC